MHTNVEIVQRALAALAAGDTDTLTEYFDESTSWHTPGKSIFAGGHIGRQAIFRQFDRYKERSGDTFDHGLQYVVSDDDGHVVSVHRYTAEREHRHLDAGCCIVFEFKDGRIADGSQYFFDLFAWDHFWS